MTTRPSIRALAVGATALLALGLTACSPEEEDAQAPDAGDGSAYEDIVESGPVAEDSAVEANEWASAVREAGTLRVGGTETSQLFSLLDVTTGTTTGFDAGLSQMLSRYILGEVDTALTQVSVDTREELLITDAVDVTWATYSITPERAERISFAGPYYGSQSAILVASDNDDISSVEDLAGLTVATQANSTGETVLEEFAPEASILALPDHAQALASVRQGDADAYVIDQTLLLNAVVEDPDAFKIVGEPFGPSDLYGIGLPPESDGVEFVNAFLDEVIASGAWEELWQLTIGDRTGLDEAPTPPTPGDTGL